ncbi:alpha-ketoglutarate-dependent dioxygenase AlkB family protein [Spongiivirga citrea]|uniref:Alpha-ketoglutarate-dependent dioxygenase AlkB n=1 Tax=Spongiivirga citrea TaxID=1481457 RepID=A0A6M0CN71_9FLAO|nr:alpha-ketoglutarate-dependent dioxygenase AlkB [Spongiivirga citrea]NER19132.1 alpha-ketoglutarate-dependent dioxygenase AlkB [Spongiivirga citrea]
MSLFNEPIQLTINDGEVLYYPRFFNRQEADIIFKQLFKETPWQEDDIKVFGKVYKQPRLTALYGSENKPYSYSNITMHPQLFSALLNDIKVKVEEASYESFNTVLLNLYRDGKDSNGWHADDEKELGENPVIASLSFGEERYFNLRHKKDKTQKHKLLLNHGSLLLMKGETQHHWHHQIPKTSKQIGSRINLTFRQLI